jgi:hypothetical protein
MPAASNKNARLPAPKLPGCTAGKRAACHRLPAATVECRVYSWQQQGMLQAVRKCSTEREYKSMSKAEQVVSPQRLQQTVPEQYH